MIEKMEEESVCQVVYGDGSTQWLLNSQWHRVGGPAVTYANGTNCWYCHGTLHRDDGPAIEYANGVNQWWIHGKEYTETEFNFWSKIFTQNT